MKGPDCKKCLQLHTQADFTKVSYRYKIGLTASYPRIDRSWCGSGPLWISIKIRQHIVKDATASEQRATDVHQSTACFCDSTNQTHAQVSDLNGLESADMH